MTESSTAINYTDCFMCFLGLSKWVALGRKRNIIYAFAKMWVFFHHFMFLVFKRNKYSVYKGCFSPCLWFKDIFSKILYWYFNKVKWLFYKYYINLLWLTYISLYKFYLKLSLKISVNLWVDLVYIQWG